MRVEVNSQTKEKAASLSVISNSLLVCSKLAVGIYTSSVSIISEAVHSSVDLLAALIAFYAIRMASKEPDYEHNYGHGKIENISGAVEAFLIIAAALWIIWEAMQKIYSPTVPQHLGYGMIIMLVSIIVNYLVSKHLFKVARQTYSHALEADALHLQADVLTSIGVLIGLIAIKTTGLSWLDPLIAILVACFIFQAGWKMTKKSLSELIDLSLSPEEISLIQKILREHPEVIDFQRLRTRRSGVNRLIDVYIILDKNMSLEQVDRICDEIEKQIRDQLNPCDVMIHAQPYESLSIRRKK